MALLDALRYIPRSTVGGALLLAAVSMNGWGGPPGHSGANALDGELSDLLRMLPGRYRSEPRQGGSGAAGRRVFHSIEAVEMPEHGERVLMHVLSLEGFDDPEPFQQKFYAFDLDPARERNRMTSIVLVRAPRWRPGQPLEHGRLLRFPPECRIPWHRDGDGFTAHVARGTCSYESEALGGRIVPDMTYRVTPERFAIRDLLYRPDGSLAIPGQGKDFLVAPRVTAE